MAPKLTCRDVQLKSAFEWNLLQNYFDARSREDFFRSNPHPEY